MACGRAMSLALAGGLIGLACKKDAPAGEPEPLVSDADVVVRVAAPGVRPLGVRVSLR